MAHASLQRPDNHEGDQDQQLKSSQGEPDTGREPPCGMAAGMESVSSAERRADKHNARTKQRERMPSAEQAGQPDAESWEHQGEGQCRPTVKRSPPRQEPGQRAARKQPEH